MQLQILLLLKRKRLNHIRTLNPPTLQRITGSFVLPNQLTIAIEADPMAVKQFVDMGRQQQTIRTIKPLRMSAIAPRLDVACNQEFLPSQTCHPADRLLFSNTMPKQPLAQSCFGQGIPLRCAHNLLQGRHIIKQCMGRITLFCQHQEMNLDRRISMLLNQLDQQMAQRLIKPCQVHPLIASP